MPSLSARDVERLPVGTRVRVTFEGTVEEPRAPRTGLALRKRVRVGHGPARTYGDDGVYLSPGQIASATTVEQIAPAWQAGDVVSIAFANGSQAPRYTYVRGSSSWLGEVRNLTDAEVSRRYAEGKVEHLIRDGKHIATAADVAGISGFSLRNGDSVSLHTTYSVSPF